MGLGILHHLVDISVAETARGLDADLLLLAGRLVFRRYVHDAIGIDIKGDLDLRDAARCRRDTHQIKLAENLVIGRHFTLALEDADGDRGLAIFGGREDLALLGRDRGVAIDQPGEDAPQGLDTEREWGHVEQQHVLDVALQDAALDCCTHRDHFVRIDAAMRFATEEFLHLLDDLRHAGHTADQDHFVDVAGLQAGILQGLAAGLYGALDQLVHQGFQLGAAELDVEMLRTRLIGRDEGQIDFGLHRAGELDLGLFRGFLQTLQRQLVLPEINALFLFELIGQVVDDAGIEIFTAEESVAVGRLHLEDAIADFQHRNIEGTTTKVIDRDDAGALLLHAVGKGGCCRFVDDAQDFQSGDLAGILGGLTLAVVEISGNRDDRLGHLFTEIILGGFLHLLQDESGDLRGRVVLAMGIDPGIAIVAGDDLIGDETHILLRHRIIIATADQPLNREQGIFRIGHGLALRCLAHQPLTRIGESDHGGRRARAFRILNHPDILAIHDGDTGIGGAKIDTDNFAHVCLFGSADPCVAFPTKRHGNPR